MSDTFTAGLMVGGILGILAGVLGWGLLFR